MCARLPPYYRRVDTDALRTHNRFHRNHCTIWYFSPGLYATVPKWRTPIGQSRRAFVHVLFLNLFTFSQKCMPFLTTTAMQYASTILTMTIASTEDGARRRSEFITNSFFVHNTILCRSVKSMLNGCTWTGWLTKCLWQNEQTVLINGFARSDLNPKKAKAVFKLNLQLAIILFFIFSRRAPNITRQSPLTVTVMWAVIPCAAILARHEARLYRRVERSSIANYST